VNDALDIEESDERCICDFDRRVLILNRLWHSKTLEFITASLLQRALHGSAALFPNFSDSSVGIALGYGLDDWGSRVRFPAGAGNFSLHHRL
jgi:hypothetical protein